MEQYRIIAMVAGLLGFIISFIIAKQWQKDSGLDQDEVFTNFTSMILGFIGFAATFFVVFICLS